MNIQFNLLPDVKVEYIKARRTKRMTLAVASLAAITALAVAIGLFVVVNVVQRQHLANLDKDIKSDTKKLQDTPDLSKVLTIQNQLSTLPGLHEKTPAASRIVDYLAQLTPADATIANTSVDFEAGTIVLTGAAKDLGTVNKFADTLKFTDYQEGDTGEIKKAFSEVVLGSFGRSEVDASYTINFKFDPLVFDNTKKIKLIVPNIISTRSQTEKPTDLFKTTEPGNQ